MDTIIQPDKLVFGLDIGTRSVVGTVGYKKNAREFVVVAQCTKLHETRAMLDGQIHDIGKVAETSDKVRAAHSADTELHCQNGKAQQREKHQIKQNEHSAAVLSDDKRKPPHITQTDRASDRQHNKSQTGSQ